MVNLRDRVLKRARANDSWVCVGLDPDPTRIADSSARGIENFLLDVIEQTSGRVCAYKPNSAFFEAMGGTGHNLLSRIIREARKHAPVILDAKRGDIGNTAEAYAKWAYDTLDADAITVNPYMGHDAVAPFAREGRGAFVLARTSNPGAADFQAQPMADGRPLFEHVIETARAYEVPGTLGFVAGATAPTELARIRELAGPDVPLLIPGVGAQGGSAQDAIRLGANEAGEHAIINASRSILYAADPAAACEKLRAELVAANKRS